MGRKVLKGSVLSLESLEVSERPWWGLQGGKDREGLKVSMYLLGVWRRASVGRGGLEVSEWDWWDLVESSLRQ